MNRCVYAYSRIMGLSETAVIVYNINGEVTS
jgi:hypothetical protein